MSQKNIAHSLEIGKQIRNFQSCSPYAPPFKKLFFLFPGNPWYYWWAVRDLNPRPSRCKRDALPLS